MAKKNNHETVSVEMVEDLATAIAGSRMTQIARTYLNIDMDAINKLQLKSKENRWKFNKKVIQHFLKENDRTVSCANLIVDLILIRSVFQYIIKDFTRKYGYFRSLVFHFRNWQRLLKKQQWQVS